MKIVSLTPQTLGEVAAQAAEVIRQGGVVLYPTDTLYGLGVNALSSEAVDTVYAIKGRDAGKPMHAIVKNAEVAERYGEMSERAWELASAFWPGALTLVLKKKYEVESGVGRGMQTIGLRVPKNDFCAAFSEAFGGAITTTSANASGASPLFSVAEILAQLGEAAEKIDLVVDAGALPLSKPSTIVDLSEERACLVREGAIRKDEIERLAKGVF